MDYNPTNLAPTLLTQLTLPCSLNSKSIITVTCDCGVSVTINYRAFLRKWAHKTQYLCKSCHVSTYANDTTRIEKFKQSFQKISTTDAHRAKCSANGKLAWVDPDRRARLVAAITADNKNNPKKATARSVALDALKNKEWYKSHMAHMNNISSDKMRLTTLEFIARSIKIHGDKYDYSTVEYINKTDDVIIRCPIHGAFNQAPANHWNGQGCRQCAYSKLISAPHQMIVDLLPPEIVVITNTRDIIPPKEIDVWLPEYNIGIEINGDYWHGVHKGMTDKERNNKKKCHWLKANAAHDAGIRLYQFFGSEIIAKPEIVRSIILNALGMSNRVYARKCAIASIADSTTKGFLDSSHLQGHRYAAVNYALMLDGEIQCVITLSKRTKHQWEIIRYANKLYTTVVGGFSKLLRHFIVQHGPTELITFADRRISNGNVYATNGFKLESITKPNYYYIKQNKKLSRQKCQKHKLRALLGDNFDGSLTEIQNMVMAGYSQVCDAGHYKFVYNFNSN